MSIKVVQFYYSSGRRPEEWELEAALAGCLAKNGVNEDAVVSVAHSSWIPEGDQDVVRAGFSAHVYFR